MSCRNFSLVLGAVAAPLLGCTRTDVADAPLAPAASVSAEVAAPMVAKPAAPAPPPAVKEVRDEPVGHLEHPSRLTSLFSLLSDVEAHKARADVRIVQLGDSHTASDYGTSVVRARLATRFGDGGRGFIPMGEPHKRLFQAGELGSRGVGFQAEEALSPWRGSRPDGHFGPTGIAMDTRAAGALLASNLSASADHLEIAYLAQPGGGSFDVYVDGQLRARVSTARDGSRASAFHTIDVPRRPHTLEARAVGDGTVRIFGVRLDDDAVGITFDSLGVNGAKATAHLASDEPHLAEQIAHIAPALVVIAYGTNECGDITTTPEDHADAVRTLVQRLKKGAPRAECVVLGPPDRGWQTVPKLAPMIAAQRRAADDAGCAFYDQFAAMGREGAIHRWSRESPPRARRDHVHMTRAGYTTLAEAFVRDLMTAYEARKGNGAVALAPPVD